MDFLRAIYYSDTVGNIKEYIVGPHGYSVDREKYAVLIITKKLGIKTRTGLTLLKKI